MNRATTHVPAELRHRLTEATVTVTDHDGTPLPHTRLTVAQVSHAFGFGNIGFDYVPVANGETTAQVRKFGGADPGVAAGLTDAWFDLFNQVTLPFYWREFEPTRGAPDTARLRRTAEWFTSRGALVKGHPLVWHTLTPTWLHGLGLDEVERLLRKRIVREVTSTKGLVTVWDAINETVIMPVFTAEENAVTELAKKLGRVGMVKLAVDTAREANPDITLLINDFNMSPSYEHVIEECLEAGVQIDALGLQSHMHQGYWGEEKTHDVLERFSRFGLPLHFTENTLLSGHLMPPEIEDLNDYIVPEWPTTPEDEDRQAEELVRHYSTLVAHPQVQVINYWGITDNGAWLGAPSGLARADGSLKPGYHALHGLVKGAWWLPETTVETDENGRIQIEGFAGAYTVSGPAGATTVDLPKGAHTVDVRL